MTSSLSDWENVNVKSELQPFPRDQLEIDEYMYDIIFKNVHPSNDQKLKILNRLTSGSTDPQKLQIYLISRIKLYYDMRQWQNVFNDINRLEQYGELNETISALKIKAIIQNELEKTRETVIKAIDNEGYTCFVEYRSLLKTIEELNGIMEGTYEAKRSFIKKDVKHFGN